MQHEQPTVGDEQHFEMQEWLASNMQTKHLNPSWHSRDSGTNGNFWSTISMPPLPSQPVNTHFRQLDQEQYGHTGDTCDLNGKVVNRDVFDMDSPSMQHFDMHYDDSQPINSQYWQNTSELSWDSPDIYGPGVQHLNTSTGFSTGMLWTSMQPLMDQPLDTPVMGEQHFYEHYLDEDEHRTKRRRLGQSFSDKLEIESSPKFATFRLPTELREMVFEYLLISPEFDEEKARDFAALCLISKISREEATRVYFGKQPWRWELAICIEDTRGDRCLSVMLKPSEKLSKRRVHRPIRHGAISDGNIQWSIGLIPNLRLIYLFCVPNIDRACLEREIRALQAVCEDLDNDGRLRKLSSIWRLLDRKHFRQDYPHWTKGDVREVDRM